MYHKHRFFFRYLIEDREWKSGGTGGAEWGNRRVAVSGSGGMDEKQRERKGRGDR
jgi:hypothetical protein